VSGFRPRFFIQQEVPGSTWAIPRPGGDLCGSELSLGAEDSHHASRVLRLSPGDDCEVVVGAAVYAATVSVVGNPVRVRLTTRLEGTGAGACYRSQVGLAQALTRPALIDHIVEKGTEVGASFFTLVQTAGSPRRSDRSGGDRLVRWRRIASEAAKQSKQVAVPSIEVVDSVADALAGLDEKGTRSLVLEPASTASLWERLGPVGSTPVRIALWIGPESGWTDAESAQFSAAGVETVRLGQSVLRTETAGPVAVAVARLALGDW
jgi:16S rRNA (uracil1498-N3)-methyltransferase